MRIEDIRSLDSLRSGLDHMIIEARAEEVEHERHVADARRRRENLQTLRAALDKPPATEPRR
jgi:hypothetical protein